MPDSVLQPAPVSATTRRPRHSSTRGATSAAGTPGSSKYSASMATATRTETDSLGAVEVPAERYWGAQTQRSLLHFSIGWPQADRMPVEVVRAMGVLKKAAALANVESGRLDPELGR